MLVCGLCQPSVWAGNTGTIQCFKTRKPSSSGGRHARRNHFHVEIVVDLLARSHWENTVNKNFFNDMHRVVFWVCGVTWYVRSILVCVKVTPPVTRVSTHWCRAVPAHAQAHFSLFPVKGTHNLFWGTLHNYLLWITTFSVCTKHHLPWTSKSQYRTHPIGLVKSKLTKWQPIRVYHCIGRRKYGKIKTYILHFLEDIPSPRAFHSFYLHLSWTVHSKL